MTLKIKRTTEGPRVVFALVGRIRHEQVEELDALFDRDSEDGNITLDLQEIKLVDREAIQFLARREAEGVEIRNCPAYIREWIEREKNSNQDWNARANGPKQEGE